MEIVDFTNRQQGIINLLKKGNHNLHGCFSGGGGAMWRKDVKWSQGRTPVNAVSQEDLDYLNNQGIIKLNRYRGIWVLVNLQIVTDDSLPFIPVDEGYCGESFCAKEKK